MADPRVSREHAQFITRSRRRLHRRPGQPPRHVRQRRAHQPPQARAATITSSSASRAAPYVLFSPDRSPTSAAQQFLSQFSTWKPAAGAGSDLEMLNVFLEAARKLNTSGVLDDVLQTLAGSGLALDARRARLRLPARPGWRTSAGRRPRQDRREHHRRQHHLALDLARCRQERLGIPGHRYRRHRQTGRTRERGRAQSAQRHLHSAAQDGHPGEGQGRHQVGRADRCPGRALSGRALPVGQAFVGQPRHSAHHRQRRRHAGGKRRAGAGRRCCQALPAGAGDRLPRSSSV